MKVGTHLFEGFEVNAGVHEGIVLLPLMSAIVIDVVTNEIKDGMSQEILHSDDLDLIAKINAELQNNL